MTGAERPIRTLRLPLADVAAALRERPAISEAELDEARRACGLIQSILEVEGGKELTAADVAGIEDGTFDAAYSIIEDGGRSAALRVAAEQIDHDAFTSLGTHLARLRLEPDPSIAGEFI